MEPEIIYEDPFLTVILKPAGMATQTARVAEEDLVSWFSNHRRQAGEDTYVGVLSRLDQPVEGLVAFAKDKATTAKLTREIEDKRLQKYYLALVHCDRAISADGWHRLEDFLVKDERTNSSRVVTQGEASANKRAKRAILEYRDVSDAYDLPGGIKALDIRLVTGRHHQIRVQLANAGMPIVGDAKYGPPGDKGRRLGLFAYHLRLEHPKNEKLMDFEIRPDIGAL